MIGMKALDPKPFSGLTPDCVMSALESIGFCCDGRLLALNSYENRVYQAGLEAAAPVVAKFYRPNRWSDAAILEEHGFLHELSEHELPVVPPLALVPGQTLYQYESFRFSVFPRQAGRAPELLDTETYERMGRLIGRIHAVGALQAYQARPALDIASFGEESLDYLLTHAFIPPDLTEAYRSVAFHALERVRACFARAGSPKQLRLHGDCYPGNILWTPLESPASAGPGGSGIPVPTPDHPAPATASQSGSPACLAAWPHGTPCAGGLASQGQFRLVGIIDRGFDLPPRARVALRAAYGWPSRSARFVRGDLGHAARHLELGGRVGAVEGHPESE